MRPKEGDDIVTNEERKKHEQEFKETFGVSLQDYHGLTQERRKEIVHKAMDEAYCDFMMEQGALVQTCVDCHAQFVPFEDGGYFECHEWRCSECGRLTKECPECDGAGCGKCDNKGIITDEERLEKWKQRTRHR